MLLSLTLQIGRFNQQAKTLTALPLAQLACNGASSWTIAKPSHSEVLAVVYNAVNAMKDDEGTLGYAMTSYRDSYRLLQMSACPEIQVFGALHSYFL